MFYKVNEEAYWSEMSPCSLAFYFIEEVKLSLFADDFFFFNSHLNFRQDNTSVLFYLPLAKGNLCLSCGPPTKFLHMGWVAQARAATVRSTGTQPSTVPFAVRLLISLRFSFLCYKIGMIATVRAPSTQWMFNNNFVLNECENQKNIYIYANTLAHCLKDTKPFSTILSSPGDESREKALGKENRKVVCYSYL